MGYIGWEQCICGNHHLYEIGQPSFESYDCPVCDQQPIWINSVDNTNGEEVGFVHIDVDDQGKVKSMPEIHQGKWRNKPTEGQLKLVCQNGHKYSACFEPAFIQCCMGETEDEMWRWAGWRLPRCPHCRARPIRSLRKEKK